MEEESRTITVVSTTLTDADKCVELWRWALTHPDVACNLAATTDGAIIVTLSGVTVPTAIAHLGDTVVWDGNRFLVEPHV